MPAPDELEVVPFSSREEYVGMLDYLYLASDEFLRGMGAERARLPDRDEWLEALLADHERPDSRRDRLYVIWKFRGERIGHSSASNIVYGKEAFLHLHLWRKDLRQGGLGSECVRRSAEIYFKRLRLKLVYSEPYAENPAPNRVFAKLGFQFVKRYRTIPGKICFEQDVNRWELWK